MKPKIHWYTLHYKGVSAGDHFTDVPGLVHEAAYREEMNRLGLEKWAKKGLKK